MNREIEIFLGSPTKRTKEWIIKHNTISFTNSSNITVRINPKSTVMQYCSSISPYSVSSPYVEHSEISDKSKLKEVNDEGGLIQKIGEGAFHYCTTLTAASFPQCTTIGSYAFYNCYSLTEFYIGNKDSTSVATLGSNVFKYYSDGYKILPNLTIYVPESLVNDYKTAQNWSEYSSLIKPYSYT